MAYEGILEGADCRTFASSNKTSELNNTKQHKGMENTQNNLMREPRGYRNNNPLNIRHSKSRWAGMRGVQTDEEFVQFESMEMGYRAACLVVLTYRKRYNRRTIRQIIERWAPKRENNTNVYVYHVCEWMHIGNPDHIVTMDEIPSLIQAMSRQETGRVADPVQVRRGFEMAVERLRSSN